MQTWLPTEHAKIMRCLLTSAVNILMFGGKLQLVMRHMTSIENKNYDLHMGAV